MAPIIPHLDIITKNIDLRTKQRLTLHLLLHSFYKDDGWREPAEVSKHNKQDIQFSVPFNQVEKFCYNGHQEVIKD